MIRVVTVLLYFYLLSCKLSIFKRDFKCPVYVHLLLDRKMNIIVYSFGIFADVISFRDTFFHFIHRAPGAVVAYLIHCSVYIFAIKSWVQCSVQYTFRLRNSSLVYCLSDPLITTFAHAHYGYSLYFFNLLKNK